MSLEFRWKMPSREISRKGASYFPSGSTQEISKTPFGMLPPPVHLVRIELNNIRLPDNGMRRILEF
jgi:hypothetical protein